jgi:hypothetical protein
MNGSNSDAVVILSCIAGIFLIGVLCLVWPRRMQRVAIWWADLGMYPFPNFVRSEAYVWVLRLLGVMCLGVTLFLFSGILGNLVWKYF